MEEQKRPTFTTILCLVLFLISIGYFLTWGYGWVNYLLSQSFGVETSENILDLFIGLIAMAASIPVFIGTVYAWRMKPFSATWMIVGPVGFIIKNLFDIANNIVPLTNKVEVTPTHITEATQAIGGDIFHMAFWAFVIAYFAKDSVKDYLDKHFSKSQ